MNTGQVAQQLRMLTQQLSRTFQSTAQPKYTQVFLFRMFHILRCSCGVKIAHARPTINLYAARDTWFLQQPEQRNSAMWLRAHWGVKRRPEHFHLPSSFSIARAVSLWWGESHFSHRTYLCSHLTLTHTRTRSHTHMHASTCHWVSQATPLPLLGLCSFED